MSNLVINGRTAVHAASGGTYMGMDICKTPPFCQPIPFSNIALSADATGTASSVIINGQPACHLGSTFATSSGDEAGVCGGLISGTIKGQAEFISSSPDVIFEGQPAVRQGDQMTSNNGNTPPAPLQQAGAGIPKGLSPDELKERDAGQKEQTVQVEDKVSSPLMQATTLRGDES